MRNKMIVCLMLAVAPLPAFAHVTLAQSQAKPGSHYMAHFKIGHGCDGSPTTDLAITIPQGVTRVEAQPKDGWTIEQMRQGTQVTQVHFSGGRIAADKPDEVVIAMDLPGKTGSLVFTTVQTCEKGAENWSELPAADGHKLTNPAPVLTLTGDPDNSMSGMDMNGMDMKGMDMPGMDMKGMDMPSKDMKSMDTKGPDVKGPHT